MYEPMAAQSMTRGATEANIGEDGKPQKTRVGTKPFARLPHAWLTEVINDPQTANLTRLNIPLPQRKKPLRFDDSYIMHFVTFDSLSFDVEMSLRAAGVTEEVWERNIKALLKIQNETNPALATSCCCMTSCLLCVSLVGMPAALFLYPRIRHDKWGNAIRQWQDDFNSDLPMGVFVKTRGYVHKLKLSKAEHGLKTMPQCGNYLCVAIGEEACQELEAEEYMTWGEAMKGGCDCDCGGPNFKTMPMIPNYVAL